jgi:cytidylate kinase
MLIIFGGLPGTGKTAIAQQLARELGAVYLRIDSMEQASATAVSPASLLMVRAIGSVSRSPRTTSVSARLWWRTQSIHFDSHAILGEVSRIGRGLKPLKSRSHALILRSIETR